MRFISESSEERIPCYRVLDDDGQPFPDSSFVKVLHLPLFPKNENDQEIVFCPMSSEYKSS